jgi:hypothetical protein
MYYLELTCPGKQSKGCIYDDYARAVRKFRQLARYKRGCQIRLYDFEMNRLKLIAET